MGRITGCSELTSPASRTVALPNTPEEMEISFEQSSIWQRFAAIFETSSRRLATGNPYDVPLNTALAYALRLFGVATYEEAMAA
jgi:hypothetical protein